MNLSEPVSFESAFARLEEILEKMNAGTLSLEDSLRLYEEADQLIRLCNSKLSAAETKIEMLVKSRDGELVLGEGAKPVTQSFTQTSTALA